MSPHGDGGHTASSDADAATELPEEEMLRAQTYALLARLLAQPPGADLLAAVGAIGGDASPLGAAFSALADAARAASPDSVANEHMVLFIGVGGSEMTPYGSYYMTGFLNEKPLADLRDDMARLGIARAEDVKDPEDHIAALCEMMAGLIAGAFAAPAALETQQAFFDRHIAPWAGRFFADLEISPSAGFYRAVGTVGRRFMDVEGQAFAMAA